MTAVTSSSTAMSWQPPSVASIVVPRRDRGQGLRRPGHRLGRMSLLPGTTVSSSAAAPVSVPRRSLAISREVIKPCLSASVIAAMAWAIAVVARPVQPLVVGAGDGHIPSKAESTAGPSSSRDNTDPQSKGRRRPYSPVGRVQATLSGPAGSTSVDGPISDPACCVGHQRSVSEKPVKRKVPGAPLVETISTP
jgi:hypothetical protein